VIRHLPVLQVVVPLVAAPLCLLLARGALARVLASAALFTTFGISLALMARVLDSGAISYALGGWAPPVGIEYRIDTLSAFVLVIVSGVAAVLGPLGPGPRRHAIPARREPLYYATFQLGTAGLLGVTFRLSGAIEAPVLSVNPLSAIAPGIFRKLFELR